MQEHVLDDGISAFPVLNDLVEIAAQHVRELVYFRPKAVVERSALERLAQFVHQLAGKGGEIVDEVERILDLVRDAGGELAKRGKLLSLDEAILGGPEIFERARKLLRARLHLLKQTDIRHRNHRLVGEGLDELDLPVGKRLDSFAEKHDHADDMAILEERHAKHGVNL